MMRAARRGALVAIRQAVVYLQGITCAYDYGLPTGTHSAVHRFIGLFTLTPWGYTNKLFSSEMLFRYKELELGL